MWSSKCGKARDMPQPPVMKEGANMGHNDVVQVRPMKDGVRSLASPMSQTGLTRIVRQQPVLAVLEHPHSS